MRTVVRTPANFSPYGLTPRQRRTRQPLIIMMVTVTA
jgi:hypothetical protein